MEIAIFPCKPAFHFLTGSHFPCLLRKPSSYHASWKTKLSSAYTSGAESPVTLLSPTGPADRGVYRASHMACWPTCRVGATWQGTNPPPISIDHLGCETILDTALPGCALGLNREARVTCQMCTISQDLPKGIRLSSVLQERKVDG